MGDDCEDDKGSRSPLSTLGKGTQTEIRYVRERKLFDTHDLLVLPLRNASLWHGGGMYDQGPGDVILPDRPACG